MHARTMKKEGKEERNGKGSGRGRDGKGIYRYTHNYKCLSVYFSICIFIVMST